MVILIFNLLFKVILAFIQKTNLGFALSVSDFVLFRYTQILTNLQSSSLFQILNKSDKSLPNCESCDMTSRVDVEIALDFQGPFINWKSYTSCETSVLNHFRLILVEVLRPRNYHCQNIKVGYCPCCRWSFRPNSARGSIEMIAIGKTHPTLFPPFSSGHLSIVPNWKSQRLEGLKRLFC